MATGTNAWLSGRATIGGDWAVASRRFHAKKFEVETPSWRQNCSMVSPDSLWFCRRLRQRASTEGLAERDIVCLLVKERVLSVHQAIRRCKYGYPERLRCGGVGEVVVTAGDEAVDAEVGDDVSLRPVAERVGLREGVGERLCGLEIVSVGVLTVGFG